MWLRAQMKLTSQCWALKELAKDIWNRPWSEERRSDWQRWLALAANSDVPMMKNAAKTIGKKAVRDPECDATQCLKRKCGGT